MSRDVLVLREPEIRSLLDAASCIEAVEGMEEMNERLMEFWKKGT